jgi:hypothetical protein
VSVGIGLTVSGVVFLVGARVRLSRLARIRQNAKILEENLPWENLLGLLKTRYGGGKSVTDEELSSDELMDMLLADIPAGSASSGADWQPAGGRRKSRRRWANPIEVAIVSPFHDKPVHGLVINRSTGGMAILTDVAFEAGTVLSVRSKDAPNGIGYVDVCIRHSRQASKLWIIGCEYNEDVPWNVKVWFG